MKVETGQTVFEEYLRKQQRVMMEKVGSKVVIAAHAHKLSLW